MGPTEKHLFCKSYSAPCCRESYPIDTLVGEIWEKVYHDFMVRQGSSKQESVMALDIERERLITRR